MCINQVRPVSRGSRLVITKDNEGATELQRCHSPGFLLLVTRLHSFVTPILLVLKLRASNS